MLCLSRRKSERIHITAGVHRITITVCELRGPKVRLGIDASKEVVIHREEIQEIVDREAIQREKGDASR